MDAVLDEYLAMKRTAPGFALVDFGNQIPVGTRTPSPTPASPTGSPNCSPATWAATPDDDLRRASWSPWRAADALSSWPSATDPTGTRRSSQETRELLRAYLARVLD